MKRLIVNSTSPIPDDATASAMSPYAPGIRTRSLLPELLGKPDENSFRTTDVAEPIHVFIPDHFADELRAAFGEPGERLVNVLHGKT